MPRREPAGCGCVSGCCSRTWRTSACTNRSLSVGDRSFSHGCELLKVQRAHLLFPPQKTGLVGRTYGTGRLPFERCAAAIGLGSGAAGALLGSDRLVSSRSGGQNVPSVLTGPPTIRCCARFSLAGALADPPGPAAGFAGEAAALADLPGSAPSEPAVEGRPSLHFDELARALRSPGEAPGTVDAHSNPPWHEGPASRPLRGRPLPAAREPSLGSPSASRRVPTSRLSGLPFCLRARCILLLLPLLLTNTVSLVLLAAHMTGTWSAAGALSRNDGGILGRSG